MLHIASLFLYFTAVWTISTGNTAVLLFPQGTVFQFTIGVSVPVAMGKRGGVAFTSGFQFNYALPWNLSQFEPAIIPAREIASFDLQDVYTALEDLLDKHGWKGGGACLLRTICELAESPLLSHQTTPEHQPDILEEIIHLLLTKITSAKLRAEMRVRIFMFICLYCVWQIETTEMLTPTKAHVPDEEGHKDTVSQPRDKEMLYPPPLVSPYGGTIKFLVGIAVPISIKNGRILGFGQNFQFQYAMPQNATFFTNYFDDSEGRGRSRRMSTTIQRRRKNRDVITKPDNTRSIFYRSLELAYERWGGNGKNCVLRSICDAAEAPLEDEGLVGELLHVMLTPNYGVRSTLDTPDDDDYLRAAQAGRSGDNCSLIYPDCPEGAGLLDRVSIVAHSRH